MDLAVGGQLALAGQLDGKSDADQAQPSGTQVRLHGVVVESVVTQYGDGSGHPDEFSDVVSTIDQRSSCRCLHPFDDTLVDDVHLAQLSGLVGSRQWLP